VKRPQYNQRHRCSIRKRRSGCTCHAISDPVAYPDGTSSQPSGRDHARVDIEPPRGSTHPPRPPVTGSMRNKIKHAVPGQVHRWRFGDSMPQTHRVQRIFSKTSGAPPPRSSRCRITPLSGKWLNPRTHNECLKHLSFRYYYVIDVLARSDAARRFPASEGRVYLLNAAVRSGLLFPYPLLSARARVRGLLYQRILPATALSQFSPVQRKGSKRRGAR
jgi:hypothetical protein